MFALFDELEGGAPIYLKWCRLGRLLFRMVYEIQSKLEIVVRCLVFSHRITIRAFFGDPNILRVFNVIFGLRFWGKKRDRSCNLIIYRESV